MNLMNKKIILFISLFTFLPIAPVYIQHKVIDLRIHERHERLSKYQDIILGMPHTIEQLQPGTLLLIIVPDDLEGVGPLEERAPFIEAARTALAWVRSYEQFFKRNNIEYIIQKESACTCVLPSRRVTEKFFIESPWHDASKKCVVITGGAGFIGSHFTKKLLNAGYRVIVIDNLRCCTGENIKELESHPDFFFVKHDVSLPFDVAGTVDAVVHAASIPSPADYYQMPIETMAIGLSGTLHTLELAIGHQARYLFVSTSEVYGDPEVHPQVESYAGNVDCMSARSPYDQSKRGAETLIQLYCQQCPWLDVRIARVFNTYGPGMRLRDGRVITNFIAALLGNKPMLIYGDGSQTRSLCYVDDMVDGLYKLLMHDGFTQDDSLEHRVFNLGNPQEYTVNEIAQTFVGLSYRYFAREPEIKKIESPDKADPRKRKPDITRAQQVLGFNPQVPFEEGLERTFTWFWKP